jgi:hypothetical protein
MSVSEAWPKTVSIASLKRVFEKGCPRSDLPPRGSKNADF